MKKALILTGGWEGHSPNEFAKIFTDMLTEEGFEVHETKTLGTLYSDYQLEEYSLIIPNWTMGSIPYEPLDSLLKAVKSGVGVAGIHGGMGDAFRSESEYQFMVGGQFVAHPGGQDTEYVVYMEDLNHPITKDIKEFPVKSERYHMHVDPFIHVLAYTPIDHVKMPVAWTKTYGNGKVFYCSVGHRPEDIENKDCYQMIKNGFLWASRD